MRLETKSALLARTSDDDQFQRFDRRLTSNDVRHLCGGVSDMTIWRWLEEPNLNFPKPIKIQSRRYWRESEVEAWLESQEVVE